MVWKIYTTDCNITSSQATIKSDQLHCYDLSVLDTHVLIGISTWVSSTLSTVLVCWSCHCFLFHMQDRQFKLNSLLHLHNLPGYNDYIRSCVVNYCCSSGNDIAMHYLYEKADLSAAVHDYRYMTTPFTEFWVDSALQIVACCCHQLRHSLYLNLG